MSVPSAEDFLASVAGYANGANAGAGTRPSRLGMVDPAHVSGAARVTFDGEEDLSDKAYPYLSTYTPTANHRVLLIPAGSTYVIAGRVLP